MSLSPAEIAYEEAHIHDNRARQQTVPIGIFGIIALLCVILRMFARKAKKLPIGMDDYLIVVSMFCGIGLVITAALLTEYGIGEHIIVVTAADLISFGKANFALQIFYVPTLTFAKLSILALYNRIFRGNNKPFQYAIYGISIWVVLWGIGVWLDVFLSCKPISTYWTKSCAPKYSTSVSTSVLNILSDLAILVLPQAQIWNLQLPMQKKVGLSIVFLLGLLATILSIIRIPFLKAGNQGGSPDATYNLIATYVFTVLEPLLAIICACLPVIQSLIRKPYASGFGFSSLRSILRSQKTTTQDNSQNTWSKIQPAESATKVSQEQLVGALPRGDLESGTYELHSMGKPIEAGFVPS